MGSSKVPLGSLEAAARGRYYPHGTRRRRTYRTVARLLLALVVLVPLAALAWVVVAPPGVPSAVLRVAVAVALPWGAIVAFLLLDRMKPGRAPWWKAAGAWLLSPLGVVLGLLALLSGRPEGALAPGTVLWAELPNDEDRGATSKVRPVVVVADEGSQVRVRWFISQDKSHRHDYVEVGPALQRDCGLGGVGHSTWLSTEARALPRTALREPVGTAPASLLAARPAGR